MGDIFPKASRVFVWLGPESHDSSMAIDCIELVSRHISVAWDQYKMFAISAEEHWADPETTLPFNKAEYISIATLLDRSWFQRLWIWQEVHLASHEKLVLVGTRTLSWDSLCTAIFCFIAKTIIQDDLNLDIWFSVHRAYNLCREWDNMSFAELTDLTKHCPCSDPRDRIFALLSLFSPNEEKLSVVPNYADSTMTVYEDAMICCTQKMGSLEVGQSPYGLP